MRIPKRQKEQSLEPTKYKVRILLFGTRGFNDRKRFHNDMCDMIETHADEPILFISGAANTGADRLIIEWCRKFGYPCLEMPADWKNPKGFNEKLGYNPTAGFERNESMARIATYGLGYWDGVSTGTADMIDRLEKRNVSYTFKHIPVQERKRER